MKDISQWLREQREKSVPPLDMQTLAGEARISQSSISRIEGGLMTPTLDTVINITRVLGCDARSIYQALTGFSPIVVTEPGDKKIHPTFSDVVRFSAFTQKNPDDALALLSEGANIVYQLIPSEFPADLLFTPKIIYLLLVRSPLFHGSLEYPRKISNETILNILSQGGAVTQNDVSQWISATKRDHLREISDQDRRLQFKIEYSRPIKENLGKIKLDALFQMDDYYANLLDLERGSFFLMIWSAAEYERWLPIAKLNWGGINYRKAGHFLVILSRWIASRGRDGHPWLDKVYERIAGLE